MEVLLCRLSNLKKWNSILSKFQSIVGLGCFVFLKWIINFLVNLWWVYERVKRGSFLLNGYGRSFWQFNLARPSMVVRFLWALYLDNYEINHFETKTNFQSNRPNLANMKSIQRGKMSNNFSRNWDLWALYFRNYQLEIWNTNQNYRNVVCQRARFLSKLP